MSNIIRAWGGGKALTDKAARSLCQYLKSEREYLIPIGWFVFDKKSLMTKINLSICKDCYKYQTLQCDKRPEFPIEAVQMPTGTLFVFCGCDLTQGFSRYFYTYRQRVCVSYENLNRAIARDIRNNKYLRSLNIDNLIQDRVIDQYRPTYIEQESILRFYVGNEVYNQLVKEMERV